MGQTKPCLLDLRLQSIKNAPEYDPTAGCSPDQELSLYRSLYRRLYRRLYRHHRREGYRADSTVLDRGALTSAPAGISARPEPRRRFACKRRQALASVG